MNYLLQRSNLENHQPDNDAVAFAIAFAKNSFVSQTPTLVLPYEFSPSTARWVFLRANKKCYFPCIKLTSVPSVKKITEKRQRQATEFHEGASKITQRIIPS